MTHKNKHIDTVPAKPVEGEAPAEPPVVSISPQELEALKAKAAQADENWDKFLRSAAELENYRKRVLREKDELARYTSERVVAALLPVLDNLERALAAAEEHADEKTSLLEGLKQIHSQFRRTLEEFGLQEVVAHAGHAFDPNLHEAISHVESAEHPEGTVLDQVQRGYKLADRLLRPARVVVSKGQGETPSAEPNDEA
jgi:molecular chaperone GrpE